MSENPALKELIRLGIMTPRIDAAGEPQEEGNHFSTREETAEAILRTIAYLQNNNIMKE